jgi:hypothetical protein
LISPPRSGGQRNGGQKGFGQTGSAFAGLFNILQESDNPPTTQARAGVIATQETLQQLMKNWDGLRQRDLPALNEALQKAGQPGIDF